MAVMNKPDGKVFASIAKQGEVATFPDLLRGWGFTFEQTAGVPAMEHFNDLFKRLDETNLYQLQRGLPEWQSSIDYPVNAFVQHNGKCYRSLKTGVNKSPETATTYWTQWGIDFSQLTPQKISAGTNNVVSQTGHTHEIDLASTTTKGLVQLTNDTGLDSESLALTAKGAKALAQQIAQNKLAVDNGFIQNSKKSSAVNSTSNDTVATSGAVKTAYDKGVEAKTAADNANNNANGRVSKNGDTMTGVFNIDYGDYSSINQWNSSRKHARTETLPDSHTNFYKISYRGDNENSELHSVHFPKRGAGKNAAYEDWVNSNYIPRSGDTTINGRHFFKNDTSWIGIVSTDSTSAGLDYTVTNGKFVQCSIRAVDIGNFSNEFQFYTTPPGSNYDTDRRQHAMTLGYGGHIWTLAYGWLQDFFAKQNDITNVWNELNNKVVKRSDFTRTWYASHYAGTEVYKIKHLGLMITLMKTQSMGARELYLPEAYDGHAIVLAQDRGSGHINVAGNDMVGNNKVKVGGRSDTSLSVLVIGFKNIP